jgi:hypothetical protein
MARGTAGQAYASRGDQAAGREGIERIGAANGGDMLEVIVGGGLVLMGQGLQRWWHTADRKDDQSKAKRDLLLEKAERAFLEIEALRQASHAGMIWSMRVVSPNHEVSDDPPAYWSELNKLRATIAMYFPECLPPFARFESALQAITDEVEKELRGGDGKSLPSADKLKGIHIVSMTETHNRIRELCNIVAKSLSEQASKLLHEVGEPARLSWAARIQGRLPWRRRLNSPAIHQEQSAGDTSSQTVR